MQAGWRGYSPGETCDSATTIGAKVCKNYVCQNDSGGSKCASGWYFSLTSRAGTQVLASYSALSFFIISPTSPTLKFKDKERDCRKKLGVRRVVKCTVISE
jgi:hypothetical protein